MTMRFSTLSVKELGETELGVIYAGVEGVNDQSYEECLHKLRGMASAMGATRLVGMQLVQSQFQWNQRTSLLATAVRASGS